MPTSVGFQFYRALHRILIDDADWAVLGATLAHLADKPAHSIIDAFDTCKVNYQLVAPFSSLPIYKLGEMLLDSRFDSPILLLQSFQFFVAFLHETSDGA